MKPTLSLRSFLPIGAALGLALISSSAQAVVLASYNLTTTTRLTATSIAPGVTASNATISGQTEDAALPLTDNQYFFDTGGGSATSTLTTPFVITAGSSRTFYLYFNSANTNSTHQDLRFTVNGVPEPSAALLGGIGILCLLRRRR